MLYEANNICSPIPYIHSSLTKQLADEKEILADDRYFHSMREDQPIDILLAADYYWDIMRKDILVRGSDPVAVASHFGWLLHGKDQSVTTKQAVCVNTLVARTSTDNEQIDAFDLKSILES